MNTLKNFNEFNEIFINTHYEEALNATKKHLIESMKKTDNASLEEQIFNLAISTIEANMKINLALLNQYHNWLCLSEE